MRAAVSTFAARWQQARTAEAKAVVPEGLGIGAALAGFYPTAADFVTPGDLLRNESLMTRGILGAR